MDNKDLHFEHINNEATGLNGARYYTLIAKKMKEIHSKIPKEFFDVSKLASTDEREEYFEGQNCRRFVMYLMSNGCEWALKNGNGCTMCGHLAKQTRDEHMISSENYVLQFQSEFNKVDFKAYPILNLYNNGSLLNDNELPVEARRRIFHIINENPDIKLLVIETRPEFVTEEKMIEIKKILPNKRVEVAIGLEVFEDEYRYMCLNKGFSRSQFEKAASIVTKHLYLRTYIMLKPPFLTESESIHEAIKSVEYAFSVGACTVSLETCTVQDYTLVNYLYSHNYYSTAWLWSIIEVVKKSANLGKLLIGMFEFYPSADKVPFNCKKCSDEVMKSIIEYNRTLNIESFKGVTCDCKEEWKSALNRKEGNIKERVLSSLSAI